jgi:hypothetical protein
VMAAVRHPGAARRAPCADATDSLWRAWQRLDEWEARCDARLGAQLAEIVVRLWSLHRLGATAEGLSFLGEIDDAGLDAQVGDAFLADILTMCFSLGAAWGSADGEERPARTVRRIVRVADTGEVC